MRNQKLRFKENIGRMILEQIKSNTQKNIRAYTLFSCFFILFHTAHAASAAPAPPQISAESAILIDAITGTVLFEKNSHARRPPASTTKIMTAIIALENTQPDDTCRASEAASKTRFSSIHLQPDEQLTMKNLLYGLLLRSANDAAVCIAENVAGSEKEFIAMMNTKAKEIGASDTHFMNPHGLHDQNHYSTAYDLALIARYATCKPLFNEIVSTKRKRIERSINMQDISITSTARLLWKLDGADGIKTGYTKEAGYCFVGSATRDDWRLISVVLNSKNSIDDSAALMQYGFKYYKPVTFARKSRIVQSVPVPGGTVKTLNLVSEDDLSLVVRKRMAVQHKTKLQIGKVRAPVTEGEKLGELTGFLNGKAVGAVNLIAGESVDRTLGATLLYLIRWIIIVICLGIVGYIGYGTAIAKIARRRRRSVTQRSRKADYIRTRRR